MGSLFIFLSACGGNTKATGEKADPETATDEVQFFCEELAGEEAETGPRYEVMLAWANGKVPVSVITSCATIAPSSYPDYQIPTNALTAVGGWWAGGGDYLYAVEEGSQILIKQGSVDEMQVTQDYGYQIIAILAEGKLTKVEPGPTISGLYALGGHDTSWIVVVDRENGAWTAEGIEYKGMLPDEDLLMSLESFELKPFENFAVSTDQKVFFSDWGQGKFMVENGLMHLVFEEKESHIAPTLRMEKISN